ncbi:hypothetical protein F7018_03740 [Tenacibaculum aiptasiae]|uniref:Uncharacterized protein n=1 Tax=Tenacibaculum aiptasiae TaxID=426481 RepID=A0A7J5AR51_9FLAO|nr:hypothetical protein [Tenacibaculum aiptasiae]KAB1159433.1 hypothetical protein F7018_03740 [Tenacibaculum aiptasiae]
MNKVLFLLCPTDCLETVVNDTFKYQNYFYTSLGNSFSPNHKTLDSLKELIIKNHIKNICFVLSNDNKIILDALGGQSFSNISGLDSFYNKITKEKRHSELVWLGDHRQDAIFSYFLNNKIKELQLSLGNFPRQSVKISGKVYNRYENNFKSIYSNLTCLKKHSLN